MPCRNSSKLTLNRDFTPKPSSVACVTIVRYDTNGEAGLEHSEWEGSPSYRLPSHLQYGIDGAVVRRGDVFRSAHRKLRDMQGAVRVMLFLAEGDDFVEFPLSPPHHAAIGHAGVIANRHSQWKQSARVNVSCRIHEGGMLPISQRCALRFIAPV